MNQSLFDVLEGRIEAPVSDAPHARAELINQFMEKINEGIRAPYKPATFRQINGQLRNYGLQDLYVFFQECARAKNFGAFFWWKIKTTRHAI